MAGAEKGLVLVVEDDRAIADLVGLYLRRDGFGVQVERDGQAGLAAVRRLRPAAVVLDIRLPGLDGWEVLTRLRADVATRAVPVVIVSILDERHRGLSLGAADYLIKPVAREALIGALRRVGAVPAKALA